MTCSNTFRLAGTDYRRLELRVPANLQQIPKTETGTGTGRMAGLFTPPAGPIWLTFDSAKDWLTLDSAKD